MNPGKKREASLTLQKFLVSLLKTFGGVLMEDSRRHKNFMMISNKFWEALYKIKLPCDHRRVFDYIYRQTKGWGADFKYISTYEIAKELELPGSSVRRIKRALIKMLILVKNGNSIGIQEDFTLWEVGLASPIKKVGPTGSINRTCRVQLLGLTGPLIKETLKEKKKERAFSKLKEEEKKEKAKEFLANYKKMVDGL